ncbi:MAG TPA: MCP four helix bundle domain-containing protein, partial [Ramlibacter sp.]|uniref:MCP four helix bundle domain-containing protein n=1 Tax=Ramlibacter sp. TaxID=1917967 RepID=UPI002D6F31B6
MKLSTRLGLAFAAMVLLTLLVAGVAASRLAAVNEAAQDLATNWLPSIKVLGEIRTVANQIRRAEADHVLSTDEAEMIGMEKRLEELRASLSDRAKAYEPLITEADEKAGFVEFNKQRDAWIAVQAKLLATSRGGEKTAEQTRALFRGESRATFNAMVGELGKLVAINDKGSKASATHAAQTYASAKGWLFTIAGLATVVAGLLATLIVRGVTRQLGGEPGDAAELARRVADGDLSAPITVRDGDNASLLAALKRMQDSLSSIVNGVRQNADSVATASGQISQGNSDLSSRTEEQASALQQTAASMKQLASTVKQNADNAQQGNELALAASTVAVRGGEVVGQVV